MRRKHVVFVSQLFPPEKGGNASRIHDTVSHLDDEGWDVTVLSPPPCYPPGEFERSWERSSTETVDGVTVHRLWTWQPTREDPGLLSRMAYYLVFGLHATLWLLWNLRSYGAVVTSTPPISTGAPGLAVSLLGKPWIVDVRDLWIDASIGLGYIDDGGVLERVSRKFQRTVLHTADRISVTTVSLGESVAEEYGRRLQEKTVLLPNGVDTSRFTPSTDRARATHTDGGDPASTSDGGAVPTIIYSGNLGRAQDLQSIVEAMAHLDHDARLQLVGGGDAESDLCRLVRDLELGDVVEFEGVVDRDAVPDYLEEATIGVAPLEDSDELAYAMPTKVYEYLSSGLPVVVTGSGEIRRFVEDADCGFHADNDPRQVADRLDTLLADEQRRTQLGSNGREHVVEHYDRRQIARRLGEELRELTGARRGAVSAGRGDT